MTTKDDPPPPDTSAAVPAPEISKSDARALEHEAARERASELEAEVTALRAALGEEKDNVADMTAEIEELKGALLESNQAEAAAHAAADQAKQLVARHERENAERSAHVDTLEQQLRSAQDDLRLQIEAVGKLERDAEAQGARKEELVALKRAAKKLGRQVTLLSGASSQRQNALENELHALRKKCQTQRLELDEFTAQLRTEFAIDKAQGEARIVQLRRRYVRLRTLQFEDKQQMLRESQEVVRAMQSQFDEFRRLAEQLFRVEARQLEDKLHTQVRAYEEELRYVTLSKDRDFDDMVKAKDAKIMSLIEGTDFNAILVKHAMEMQQLRQHHRESVQMLRREWGVSQRRVAEGFENQIANRDAEIEALRHRIETAEERHRHLQETARAQSEDLAERQLRRDEEFGRKQREVDALTRQVRMLTQDKLNLRHVVLKMRLDANGGYNESLVSLVSRLKKEMDALHTSYSQLQEDYTTVCKERDATRSRMQRAERTVLALRRDMEDQRVELASTAETLKRSIRRRSNELNSESTTRGPRGGGGGYYPAHLLHVQQGNKRGTATTPKRYRRRRRLRETLPMTKGLRKQQQRRLQPGQHNENEIGSAGFYREAEEDSLSLQANARLLPVPMFPAEEEEEWGGVESAGQSGNMSTIVVGGESILRGDESVVGDVSVGGSSIGNSEKSRAELVEEGEEVDADLDTSQVAPAVTSALMPSLIMSPKSPPGSPNDQSCSIPEAVASWDDSSK